MKQLAFIAMSFTVFASSGAFAQGITRADVTQQLLQAEQSGSQLVTEASYPNVGPVNSDQAARMRSQGASEIGGATAGTSASGLPVAITERSSMLVCVGPRSFCNTYAGS
jgi:hypothetical protein